MNDLLITHSSIQLNLQLVLSRLYQISAALDPLTVKNTIPRQTMMIWMQMMVERQEAWAGHAFLCSPAETLLWIASRFLLSSTSWIMFSNVIVASPRSEQKLPANLPPTNYHWIEYTQAHRSSPYAAASNHSWKNKNRNIYLNTWIYIHSTPTTSTTPTTTTISFISPRWKWHRN